MLYFSGWRKQGKQTILRDNILLLGEWMVLGKATVKFEWDQGAFKFPIVR
jgi:hypothetical protein